MQPVQKALWYIEHRFFDDIALGDIAAACAITPYHLARAFGLATGMTVMRYVRARRLSTAALTLAGGQAGSILQLALETGYGSHEAFTRAFRDQFGVTPEAVRKARSTSTLILQEPIRMTDTDTIDLAPPRLEEGRAMTIAGLKARYTMQTMGGVPSQWQRFVPWLGNIDGQLGTVRYGLVCDGDEETGTIDYMTGVEVRTGADLPPELESVRLDPQLYAVFTHQGHITGIGQTWSAIFNRGLPATGRKMVRAPQFELIDDRFDPETGNGEIEIWVPVER